jgi:hypothetical protein
MSNTSTKPMSVQSEAVTAFHLTDDWFDPIETGLRDRVLEFIQAMIEAELEAALSRPRRRPPKTRRWNGDGPDGISGHRHGHRSPSLTGPAAV